MNDILTVQLHLKQESIWEMLIWVAYAAEWRLRAASLLASGRTWGRPRLREGSVQTSRSLGSQSCKQSERASSGTAKCIAICRTFCLYDDNTLINFTMRWESIYLIKSEPWLWPPDAHAWSLCRETVGGGSD